MERLLERFGRSDQDQAALWASLINKLRPPQAAQADKAAENLRALSHLLARRSDLLANLRGALLRLFDEHKQVTMYVSSGLLPSTGFFSETFRRVGGRLLPEIIDTSYLKDFISAAFHRVDDEIWVNAIPDEDWQALLPERVAAYILRKGLYRDPPVILPPSPQSDLP